MRNARDGARHTLALVCAVFLSVGIVLAGLGPTLPQLAVIVGHDVAALGSLFTAISAGGVLTQFGVGPASDRFGQRLVLSAGLVVLGGGAIGMTLGHSLVALLCNAFLIGIGFGAVLAAGNVLVARLFSTRSAAALNVVNLFFGVGSMLGPAIAGLGGARLNTPQVALWVGAGLILALAPAVVRYAAAPPSPTTSLSELNSTRARPAVFWLLGFLLLFYIGTEVGFGGWVTLYLITGASFTPTTAALVASGFWLAVTVGRALGAILGLRLPTQRLLRVCLLGILASAALLVVGVGSHNLSIMGVLLFGLSCGPVFPSLLALVAAASAGSNTLTSYVLALGNCGGMILPALLGLLLGQYGPPMMAAAVLVLALGMVALGSALVLVGGAVARPAVDTR